MSADRTTWAPVFTISKDFDFAASHHLYGLPSDHQCSRVHGHNYLVRVALESAALDETGFVLDYGQMKPIKGFIDEHLDHQDLNEVLPDLGGPSQPSAENMAAWLLSLIVDHALIDLPPLLSAVSVAISETPRSWATARRRL